EERTAQAAAAARAEAEQELHATRAELERLRLSADVGIPAEVARRVQGLLAEGEASAIAAKGEAVSGALSHLREAWVESGEHAMDMVAMQHLDDIFSRVTTAATSLQAKQ